MRNAEPARETFDGCGLAGGIRPQAMVDGDGDEFRRAPAAPLERFAQRAASTRSAVESGPPDTARTRPRKYSRPENNAFASSARTACSTVDTLLFPIHVLLHACRRARIFAQHLAERGAGRFLLAQSRKRLTEPHQRIGRARAWCRIWSRPRGRLRRRRDNAAPGTGFRRANIAPPASAGRPEICAGNRGTSRRGPIVLVHHVAIGEIVFVFRRSVRRQRDASNVAPVAFGLDIGAGGAPSGAAPACGADKFDRSSGAPG